MPSKNKSSKNKKNKKKNNKRNADSGNLDDSHQKSLSKSWAFPKSDNETKDILKSVTSEDGSDKINFLIEFII